MPAAGPHPASSAIAYSEQFVIRFPVIVKSPLSITPSEPFMTTIPDRLPTPSAPAKLIRLLAMIPPCTPAEVDASIICTEHLTACDADLGAINMYTAIAGAIDPHSANRKTLNLCSVSVKRDDIFLFRFWIVSCCLKFPTVDDGVLDPYATYAAYTTTSNPTACKFNKLWCQKRGFAITCRLDRFAYIVKRAVSDGNAVSARPFHCDFAAMRIS